VVGLDADDPRYAANRDRIANWDELEEEINAALLADTVERWMQRLDEAGVPAGRIRTMDQVYGSEQVAHLGLVDRVSHPTAGDLDLPGAPVRWSRSGRRPPEAPPRLGQHTDEVLRDLLDPTDDG
jgi:crotonobetainyl-CoA:carnitine CoA-transferase CaiB-like acyl-CoA transferase